MEKLKECPICGVKMIEQGGNFGHPREYSTGIESTCPIRGQIFDVSERDAWNYGVINRFNSVIAQKEKEVAGLVDKNRRLTNMIHRVRAYLTTLDGHSPTVDRTEQALVNIEQEEK